ncbi:hypothetical protein HRbin15_01495 [bacterium HR15]|nr:hypothetical protein HRbin15_01495 [bacterium HR15]
MMRVQNIRSKSLARVQAADCQGVFCGEGMCLPLHGVRTLLTRYYQWMHGAWKIVCILTVSLSGAVPIPCKAQDILIIARYVGERVTRECPSVPGESYIEYREHIVLYDPTLWIVADGCALGHIMYRSFSGVYRVTAYWFGDFTNLPPVEKIKLKIDEEVSATALMGWARATSLNVNAYARCPLCWANDRRTSSKKVVYELPWSYVYLENGGYWEAEIEIPMELVAATPYPPPAGSASVGITVEPMTKFILIHSSKDPTYRKAYDSSGNVIRALNPPGEGDTILDERLCLIPPHIGLGSHIDYVVDLYPNPEAWHEEIFPCNPRIDWSHVLGAKAEVEYFGCRVMGVDHDFCYTDPKLPFTDSIAATAHDQEDGFEDNATYVMRLHNEIEKYKLLRVRAFDWSEGAIIATMRNQRPEDITWTVQVERESSFTWGTQITGTYTVSNKALGLEFGAEVSHSTSETYRCGIQVGVTMTLHPGECGIYLVRPIGYREEWLCDVYDQHGFVGQTTVCHSTRPPATPYFHAEVHSLYGAPEDFVQKMSARRAQLWCATQMSEPVPCR